ncbi:MAG: hypothetical protein ACYTBZ_29425 [Planctomycetota bacterium]|jgi:hypothetical protein
MMRKFTIIILLFFVGWMVMLASEPACGQTNPYHGKWYSDIPGVYFVHTGGNSPTIASVVSKAAAGDVIYLWPGSYTVSNVTVDKRLTFKGMGAHYNDVTLTNAGTVFTLGADSVRFGNLYLTNTDNSTVIDNSGGYNYSFDDSRIRCSTFVAGDGLGFFTNCQLEPQMDFTRGTYTEGWVFRGASSKSIFRNCQMGYNIPAVHSDTYGIYVTDTANTYWYDSQLYTKANEAMGVLADSGAKSIFYGCVFKTDSSVIHAYGNSSYTFDRCFVESQANNDYAIVARDSATTHIVNSVVKNVASFDCLLLQSEHWNQTIYSSIFRGDIVCDSVWDWNGSSWDEDQAETPGYVKFYGFNSIEGGQIFDSTRRVVGKPIAMGPIIDNPAFTGNDVKDTLRIPGISASSAIQVTWETNNAVPGTGDWTVAVSHTSLAVGTDSLVIARGPGTDNTSALSWVVTVHVDTMRDSNWDGDD